MYLNVIMIYNSFNVICDVGDRKSYLSLNRFCTRIKNYNTYACVYLAQHQSNNEN